MWYTLCKRKTRKNKVSSRLEIPTMTLTIDKLNERNTKMQLFQIFDWLCEIPHFLSKNTVIFFFSNFTINSFQLSLIRICFHLQKTRVNRINFNSGSPELWIIESLLEGWRNVYQNVMTEMGKSRLLTGSVIPKQWRKYTYCIQRYLCEVRRTIVNRRILRPTEPIPIQNIPGLSPKTYIYICWKLKILQE